MDFRKFIISFILPLIILFSGISHAQTTPDPKAQAAQSKSFISTFDKFSKTISETAVREVVGKFTNVKDFFGILVGLMTLIGIAQIIVKTGLESSAAVNAAIKLVSALVIISCFYSSRLYQSSGLSTYFQPESGSTGFLDTDVIFWAKDKFDIAAKEIWGKDVRAEFEDARSEIYVKLFEEENKKKAEEEKAKKEGGILSNIVGSAVDYLSFFSSLSIAAIFSGLNIILEYIYTGILVAAVAIFAIQTGLAILFFKLVAFMGILPDYRDRVWKAFKVPLSTSLYNFVNLAIVALTTIAYRAIQSGLLSLDPSSVKTMSVCLSVFGVIVIIIQILCIIYIPKVAREILDGSIEQITGFAQLMVGTISGALQVGAQLTAATTGVGSLMALGSMAKDGTTNTAKNGASGANFAGPGGGSSFGGGGSGVESYPDPSGYNGSAPRVGDLGPTSPAGTGMPAQNFGSGGETKLSSDGQFKTKPEVGSSLIKNKSQLETVERDEDGSVIIDDPEDMREINSEQLSFQGLGEQSKLAPETAPKSKSETPRSSLKSRRDAQKELDVVNSQIKDNYTIRGKISSGLKGATSRLSEVGSSVTGLAKSGVAKVGEKTMDAAKYLTSKDFVNAAAMTAAKGAFYTGKAVVTGVTSGSIERGFASLGNDFTGLKKHNLEKVSVDKENSFAAKFSDRVNFLFSDERKTALQEKENKAIIEKLISEGTRKEAFQRKKELEQYIEQTEGYSESEGHQMSFFDDGEEKGGV